MHTHIHAEAQGQRVHAEASVVHWQNRSLELQQEIERLSQAVADFSQNGL
jgi:hypothetical protein